MDRARTPTGIAVRGRWVPAWVLAVVVMGFAWLVYANTLGNEFVWDDRTLIVENADVKALDGAAVEKAFTTHYWEMKEKRGGLYRPLSALSFHLDYALYGMSPRGFHFTNTVLNAGMCALVFVFLLAVFGNAALALIASLLFAAFPTHTENVSWVAGRTDLIAGFFMLLSLAGYAAWRRRGRWWRFALSILAFVAALLGKEFALVLPPLVLVLETGSFPRLGRKGDRDGVHAARLALVSLAFFGVAAMFFVLRRAVLGASVLNFEPFARGVFQTAALALSILARYVYQLLFPFFLNAESEFPVPSTFFDIHTLMGLALVAVLALSLWRWRRRGEVVLGIAIVVVGLAPVLNIFPITEVSADRFLFFPSLGFCLLAATVSVSALPRWRLRTTALVALLLIAYGARTISRNADWHSEATLFTKTAAAAGDNARAHLNLGNVHYRAGRPREALAEYRLALDIDPEYAEAWSGSAGAYKDLGQLDPAFSSIERAIALDPENASYQNSLGILYVRRGEFKAAVDCFRRALGTDPSYERARFNLGLALFNNGDFQGTIDAFTALDGKDGDYVHAYYYMAMAASQLGDRARASEFAAEFLSHYDRDDDYRRGAQAILSGQ
jgi:tetratricopeptide (TPR) repeat protein